MSLGLRRIDDRVIEMASIKLFDDFKSSKVIQPRSTPEA